MGFAGGGDGMRRAGCLCYVLLASCYFLFDQAGTKAYPTIFDEPSTVV